MVKNMTVSVEHYYTAYQKSFEKTIQKFELAGIAGPVLMSPATTGYEQQSTRLLVVGAATSNWSECHCSVRAAMDHYSKLANLDGGHSLFWDVRTQFEQK